MNVPSNSSSVRSHHSLLSLLVAAPLLFGGSLSAESALTAPDAPSSLTVYNDACYGSNLVTWATSAGATYYELYRSTSAAFTSPVLIYSGPDDYYELNVPANGWYVRVKACNADGCSGFSSQGRAPYFNGCL